jgi:KUP system potassium uptake protein
MPRYATSTPDQATETPEPALSLPALSLAALGVVFGDIGTSPLYALKAVLDVTRENPPTEILGALSLIVWTLIIITSVKYIILAMRVDNDGEGGILALMALLRMKQVRQPIVLFIGLFGAALLYGDSTITPAISVLSALEGLNIVTPDLQSYVLPAVVVILIVLFAIQQHGTPRIGQVMGPVMLLWFAVMALLGLWGIVQHPAVLWGLNPAVGLRYLFGGGATALRVLGGVFLCVTGAEVLYVLLRNSNDASDYFRLPRDMVVEIGRQFAI